MKRKLLSIAFLLAGATHMNGMFTPSVGELSALFEPIITPMEKYIKAPIDKFFKTRQEKAKEKRLDYFRDFLHNIGEDSEPRTLRRLSKKIEQLKKHITTRELQEFFRTHNSVWEYFYGVRYKEHNKTSLCEACANNNLAVVQILLEHDAATSVNIPDANGRTPLRYACIHNNYATQ